MISKGKMNEWKIIGNVGRDAEIVNLKDSRVMIKFSLATAQGFRDEDSLWVNIVQFVDSSTKYGKMQMEITGGVKKGDYVLVNGCAKMHEYDKKDGTKGLDLSNEADSVIILREKNPRPRGEYKDPRPQDDQYDDLPRELGGPASNEEPLF